MARFGLGKPSDNSQTLFNSSDIVAMKSPLPALLLASLAFVSWPSARRRQVPCRAVKGYFAIRDLLVVERKASDVEAFHRKEQERWRRVYDEDYVEAKQEFYPGDRVEAVKARLKGVSQAFRGVSGLQQLFETLLSR